MSPSLSNKPLRVESPINVPNESSSEASAKEELRDLNFMDEVAKQSIRTLINRAIFWGGHILLFMIILVLIVRVCHFVFPEGYLWLTQARLKEIDHIIIGMTAGFATRFLPRLK